MAAARAIRNQWNRPARPHTAGATVHREDPEALNGSLAFPLKNLVRARLPCAAPQGALVGSLMVEGSQTGQVIFTEATTKRQPDPDNRRIAELEAKIKRLTEALEKEKKERVKDQNLIRKLQEELQSLNRALHARDAELKAMDRLAAELRGQLSCVGDDHLLQLAALQSELQQAKEDAALAASKVPILQQEAEELRALQRADRAARDAERAAAEEAKAALEKTVGDLQSQLRTMRTQLELAQRKNGQLGMLQREKDQQLAEALERAQQELETRTAQLEALQAELAAQQRRMELHEDDLQWHKDQTLKYNRYLQRICQPQFSVVKDHTLTPVDPNGFDVVEGHVLVPLQLLLEGYALLPEDMRQVFNQMDYNPPTAQSVAPAPVSRPTSASATRRPSSAAPLSNRLGGSK